MNINIRQLKQTDIDIRVPGLLFFFYRRRLLSFYREAFIGNFQFSIISPIFAPLF